MKQRNLKTTILMSFFVIIVVVGLLISSFGVRLIKKNIVERAQQTVKKDLHAARAIYNSEIELIKTGLRVVKAPVDTVFLRESLGLDYVYVIDKTDAGSSNSKIVQQVATSGEENGGTRVINKDELMSISYGLYTEAQIDIVDTPHSRPVDKKTVDRALAFEYARPLTDQSGTTDKIIYGGKIINKDFALVDKVRDMVFEKRLYEGKPIGTVTIFFDDVRIATNVFTTSGERAIGTLVSQEVYENVVEKGQKWVDRAFVVNDWYLTGYEPIQNIEGTIIGILYVGTLEGPYRDLFRNVFLIFIGVILLVSSLAIIISFVLAHIISRPLWEMLEATCQIYEGDFQYKVKTDSSIKELNSLAVSFNMMAEKLDEREKSLKVSNEKLATLNKSYLDLISFVSHELKGILSSTVLNAYAVRDGFLGLINFKQRKAMDSVTRNLDYLTSTVRNYLDLSRIEKGELEVHKEECTLKADIFDVTIEAFAKQAAEREILIKNQIDAGFKVSGDNNLLQIVANNVVGNAIKYGRSGGEITLRAEIKNGEIEIEVYNDGRPLNDDEIARLFQRFSRLNAPEGKRVHGSGLGLFITKEIIEKHGGRIWAVACEKGNSFYFTLPIVDVSVKSII
ncbi:MAG: cache domain-containing protein [Candidatus Omnitrophica bacterium]|nr:cache domain-containing protein [Candidatus Omnitrophota bacterium]